MDAITRARPPHIAARWSAALASLVLAALPFSATAGATDSPQELRLQAEQALRDHFPARAAKLLRQALDGEDLPEDERPGLSVLLIESLIRSGNASDAQLLLDSGLPGDHPERHYWQTLVHAFQDRKDEAVFTGRQALLNVPTRLKPSLLLTLAALLEDTGRSAEAVDILQPLIDGPEGVDRQRARLRAGLILRRAGRLEEARAALDFEPAKTVYLSAYLRWLRAEIDLASGEYASAAADFGALLDEEARIPAEIASLAELGRIHALLALRLTDSALENLSVFVSGERSSSEIETALDLLRSHKQLSDSRIRALLETWSNGEDPDRQAVASLFLAIALAESGKSLEAIDLLSSFESDLAQHEIAPRAILLLGQLQLRQGRLTEAARLVERLFQPVQGDLRQLNRKWMFLTGEILALRGDWTAARTAFRNQRLLLPDTNGARARYNAALLSHLLNEDQAFEEDWKVFRALPVALPSTGKGDLLLETALTKASESDPQAVEDLETFLEDYPAHNRVAEALATLAEFYLNATPTDTGRCRTALDRLQSLPNLSDKFRERHDYLRVWLASAEEQVAPRAGAQSASSADPEVAEKVDPRFEETAATFLERWPASPFRSKVRLKLAEHLLNKGDSANALIQFRILARENPDTPLEEQARFLAGKALVLAGGRANISEAIAEWNTVAQDNGPLALRARLEQALALNRAERRQDALVVFDALLARREIPADLRLSALLAKGETLYVLAQSPSPVAPTPPDSEGEVSTEVQSTTPRDYLNQAIAVFEGVAADPEAPQEIQDEARYRLARCHEQNGDLESTLETLLEVANSTAASPRGDWTWYFRAGLEALRLLDRDRKWEATLQLAKRLSAVNDPRAAEAAAYADRLRLEHYIFED